MSVYEYLRIESRNNREQLILRLKEWRIDRFEPIWNEHTLYSASILIEVNKLRLIYSGDT